jgi:hypothetical protein
MTGYHFGWMGENIGLITGQKGVDYYGEAHLSKWNSLIHTVFMPFTTYGILGFATNLLLLSRQNAIKLMNCLYLFYLFHYLQINYYIGSLFGISYLAVLVLAQNHYVLSYKHFLYRFGMAFVSLSIQEYLGHYIGGDIHSRAEGVLNAILYANFYALESFFKYGFKHI